MVKGVQVKPAPQQANGALMPLVPIMTLDRRRKSRSMTNLDQDIPFSWPRCVITLVSYALLLSDVLRTGLGIRQIPSHHQRLEPDTMAFIGPIGSSAVHLTLQNATTQASTRLWLYKYDTTSIGLRALAQHFQLSAWSPCVLYQEACDETGGLPLHSLFSMIDSLVQVSRARRYPTTLRVNSVFRDRLHHYVMPWFYEYSVKRTVQATSYDWNESRRSLCQSRQAPYACSETWTRHLTIPCKLIPSRTCRDAQTVWREIPRRIQLLLKLYPGSTVDSVVIDTVDDYTRSGLTFQGRRRSDVVVLSRVLMCKDHDCTPIAMDDYRFQTIGLILNVNESFSFVALLRVLGQVYTWLRVVLLAWVCHIARAKTSRRYRCSSRLAQARMVLRTIFLVPSQVIIYGSLAPVALYFVAHLIDSPATYALVSVKFNTILGAVAFSVFEFIHHCAVSMRTVWVLSFYCHVLVCLLTRSPIAWSPSHGIPGVPEFFITSVASLTILAEYRALVLRNTKVLEVHEVVASARMRHLRAYSHNPSQTTLNNLLFGSNVDWKCLQTTTATLAVACAILWMCNRVSPKRFPFHVAMVSRTLVPYSAGYLWPRNRLVVSWFGSLVAKSSVESFSSLSKERQAHVSQLLSIAMPVATFSHGKSPRSETLRKTPDRGLVIRNTRASRQARRELESATSRSREIESAIYLMNLAVMTDPVTMLRLRCFGGYPLTLYESSVTRQHVWLPRDMRTSTADIAIDWDELHAVAIANTKDLEWDELLRCG